MRISENAKRWIATLAPLLVFAIAVAYPVMRAARSHCYHHEDLGIYGQALAHISFHDLNPYLSGRQLRIFNDHFDPILLLAAPLIPTNATPANLVLVEFIFLCLAIAPLAWLSIADRLRPAHVFFLALLLLWEPGTLHAFRFPIHPTTWALAAMMFVVATVMLERWRLALVALALLFACKEEFAFSGIMLGVLVWRQTRSILCLSVSWALLAFIARPLILGPSSNYGAALFVGFFENPQRTLVSPSLSHGLWDFAMPVVVVVALSLRRIDATQLRLIALSAPLLAIRFMGAAWGAHYLAPLVPIVVGIVAQGFKNERVPSWATYVAVVALAMLDAATVRFALSRTLLPAIAAGPRFCPEVPDRLASLDAAFSMIDGPALVEGNLLPALISRSDVYAAGGFHSEQMLYAYVLFEKQELGDRYPLSRQDIAGLIEQARLQAAEIIVDSKELFFARGTFKLPGSGVESRNTKSRRHP